MTKKGKIYIVVGGQWGSEAKGLFCSYLATHKPIDAAVRTGSVNAGHTVFYEGNEYKNQQIPVAWVNPNTHLVIGAGAYVHPEVLQNEIEMVEKATGKSLVNRLHIDIRAGLHSPEHKEASKGRHERYGTVGEGVSAAICDRLRRQEGVKLFKDSPWAKKNKGIHFQFSDTVEMLNDLYDLGSSILVEGTQGTLLDVYLGDYPYTTSRQTVASSWLAECGLAPNLSTEIAMVCRTYPIRVAGNSGPMPYETTWVALATEMNRKAKQHHMGSIVCPESLRKFALAEKQLARAWKMPNPNMHLWPQARRDKYAAELSRIHKEAFSLLDEPTKADLFRLFETTTVTKKLRRIAYMDYEALRYACTINRPDYLVLNFLNYEFPTLYAYDLKHSPERHDIDDSIKTLEEYTRTRVRYVNWRPNQMHEYQRPRNRKNQ